MRLDDRYALLKLIKSCGKDKDLLTVSLIHAKIAKKRIIPRDIYVSSALICTYAKCGAPEKAKEVFDLLQVRDTVAWTALISAYSQDGSGHEALKCFKDMKQHNVSPAAITYVGVLKACGSVGSAEKGESIHAQIIKDGLLHEHISIGTALVDMYSKCGSMVDAQGIFDEMPEQDCVTWNALIGGYAHQGEVDVVIDLVEKMSMEGIPPNEITLISVLIVCSHCGLIKECQRYLEFTEELYWNIFTVKKLNCVIDLLSRAGRLSEGLEIVRKVDILTDVVTWNTILSACQKMGDLNHGRTVFEHMMRLGNKDDGAYIMMSNLYAEG